MPDNNTARSPGADDAIRFLHNGTPVTARGVEPARSLLTYLRNELRCTGTKEGCAEGDCGACTVVVGELVDDRLELKSVNACIQFLPMLDGKAVFTVEGLRQPDGGLHPVQQAMVECHGSQCGFCTPGFVMSLWSVYNEHVEQDSRPDSRALRTQLAGNLCRCTGYRPILEAGEKMFELPGVHLDRDSVCQALRGLRRSASLTYEFDDAGRTVRFYAPRTLDELTNLRAEFPHATLLAGCTDIGLWVNKQLRDLGDIIFVGEVAGLKKIERHEGALRIGGAVSLTDAYGALVEHYPETLEMWERFASVPIRNAGTLGGNIANGSPIGDSMPWLIAVGARVVLRNREHQRTIALESLYVDYMNKSMSADEIVEAIEVPVPPPDQRFRTYKVAKRYDSDISAVCAAFAITLGDGGHIAQATVAFGGLAAIPKRAANCEAALKEQPWNENTVHAAAAALAEDFAPLTDMRASSEYRLQSAQNLLQRFFLETRPDNPLPAEALSVFAADAGESHEQNRPGQHVSSSTLRIVGCAHVGSA